MSINNSREFLDSLVGSGDWLITDHLVAGRNVQLAPGTFPLPDWDNWPYAISTVTFTGTSRNDALLGGGGELYAFFMGTRGDDLYGAFTENELGYVDYSGARTGVFVDLRYTGTRTFTDAEGEVRTVGIVGKASDGFGGTDYFADSPNFPGSGMYGFFGSSHRDVMIADSEGEWGHEFYGGAGKDLLINGVIQYGGAGNDRLVNGWLNYGEDGCDLLIGGTEQHGGAGNDRLVGRVTENGYTGEGDGYWGEGGEGNDCLLGTDFIDALIGGAGDDRILAGGGDDWIVTGNEGDDHVDGGAGDDFIDGGVGRDVLVSGAGSDTINPDVELFQAAPDQARDGARDVIRITREDIGDFNDVVLSRAFEAGRDQIRFGAARDEDFRVYHENQSINPATGLPFRSDDLADRVNTVLQIDQDGDGFGATDPDADDYFLFVLDADLALRSGFLLT